MLLRTRSQNSPGDLISILDALSRHVKYDCSTYKTSSILRCVESRIRILGLKNLDDYFHFISKSPGELNTFQESHLIGVTSFFRNPEAFDFIKNEIISSLIQKKSTDETLRIWIPACSTGEEAYSIAIIVQECMHALNHYPSVKIFATDVNEVALKKARDGIYPQRIKNNIPLSYLKKYFIKTAETYNVGHTIRNMVIFCKQNLINDPPFTHIDFISCRNFLIYMNEKTQHKIYNLLHFSLRDDGILFTGTSETIVKQRNLYKNISARWKLYKKNKISSYLEASLNFPTAYRTHDFLHHFSQPLVKTLID